MTATPITELMSKKYSQMVEWTQAAVMAFVDLKRALCSKTVLAAPDFSKEFMVQVDASDVDLGVVLSQTNGGEECTVLYLSQTLLPRGKNYAMVEKECLAVQWAPEPLQYCLFGWRFTLVTEHSPLQWMA